MPKEIDVSGFDQLRRNADRLAKTKRVKLAELCPPSFMRKYTDFHNIQNMFDQSGFKIETENDLESIPPDKLNAFIREKTRFSSWQEMLDKAAAEWAQREVTRGLG